MGQKVSPTGLRVGIIRDWDAAWYASKNDVADLLLEDLKIREFLNETYKRAAISRVIIERLKGTNKDRVKIRLYTGKPGVVIGHEAETKNKVVKELAFMTKKEIILNVVEIKKPELDATLVAKSIAEQLEARASFRRVQKVAIQRALKAGAKGAETLLGKAAKEAPGFVGSFANPAIMELADEVAYANDEGSHRQNANVGDVLLGGGINYGMGKLLRGVVGEPKLKGELQTKVDKADDLLARGIEITREKADDAILAYGKHSPEYAEAQKNLQWMLVTKKTLDKQKAKIKQELGSKDKYPLKNKTKYAVQQDVPTLITNELGDAVSDDPKMTKRVIRYGARVPFVGGMISPMIDAYYNAKNEQDARKKVDDLIYGLQDWRNE